MKQSILFLVLLCLFGSLSPTTVKANDLKAKSRNNASTRHPLPADYVWDTPSQNSSESMPLGGGDIGLGVWVEDNDILFYLSRSGAFDENNTLLKLGRFRLRLTPELLAESTDFEQRLHLSEGYMTLRSGKTEVLMWVDVFRPIVHIEISSPRAVDLDASYESWRVTDTPLPKAAAQQCSYKWIIPKQTVTRRDSIRAEKEMLTFFHRNQGPTVFDFTVRQQGLTAYIDSLYDPLSDLTFGGRLSGTSLRYDRCEELTDAYGRPFTAWHYRSARPARRHHLQITLETSTESLDVWHKALSETERSVRLSHDREQSIAWWRAYWQRSHITAGSQLPDSVRNALRNFALFRYMLGCNAHGDWPTKFNGGLFTFDPSHVHPKSTFTPDYRRWGGGTHTAQNQRLVYWGMLKSGDFEMMRPQLDFYLRLLPTAELRSRHYWGHSGACFTEQMENFGLPNPAEYGNKRPASFDPGVEYNAWLEYEWDTALEFCLMALELHRYANMDITPYEPLIESCLTFFDEHYRYLARQRGRQELDGAGHLVLYPGSACETYKMTYNSASTISALLTVHRHYMDYRRATRGGEDKDSLFFRTPIASLDLRLPPLPTRTLEGRQMIAPAQLWERINNVETPQLYPVFPWRLHGYLADSASLALNTYLYDPDALRFRTHKGWKQDNIWAACLGLTDDAMRLTMEKLASGPHRFPAYWGPGYDWTPDHNWGGSAMIGLQEMLVQERDGKILLFPAWDPSCDVSFRLHLPYGTIVEAACSGGRVSSLRVTPESRAADVIDCLQKGK